MSKTLGEERVRTTFNPSNSSVVEDVKQIFAREIDRLETLKKEVELSGPEGEDPRNRALRTGETNRLIAIAQTKIEDAAHWAVKAFTAPR